MPTDQPKQSYRTIYVPTPRFRIPPFVLVAVAFSVWLVVTLIAVGVISVIVSGTPTLSNSLIIICEVFAVVMSLLTTPCLLSLRHMLVMRRTRLRSRRLDLILMSPNAAERLPHRLVERALRSSFWGFRKACRVIRSAPPGTCILVQAASQPRGKMLRPTSEPFEPVSIDYDTEAAVALVNLSRVNPQKQSEAAISNARKQKRPSRPLTDRRALLLGIILLLPAWYTGIFGLKLTVGFMVGYLALWLIVLSRDQQEWVVPGGLAIRSGRAWWRKSRIEFFTAKNAAVFVDLRVQVGCASDPKQFRRFGSLQRCGQEALVAGWISAARTPTLEEVRSLLDPDDAT